MLSNTQSIKDYDPDLWKALNGEINRQEDHIELIASENYASKDTTEDANLLTLLKALLSKELRNFLVLTLQTFSPIQVLVQT